MFTLGCEIQNYFERFELRSVACANILNGLKSSTFLNFIVCVRNQQIRTVEYHERENQTFLRPHRAEYIPPIEIPPIFYINLLFLNKPRTRTCFWAATGLSLTSLAWFSLDLFWCVLVYRIRTSFLLTEVHITIYCNNSACSVFNFSLYNEQDWPMIVLRCS